MNPRSRVTACLLGALLLTGCRRPAPVSWKVLSHESESGPWVVQKIDRQANVTRDLTLMCESSQVNTFKVTGANACNLLLGRTMVPNTQTDTGDYLDIEEAGTTLIISEGPPFSRVVQHFSIQDSRAAQP